MAEQNNNTPHVRRPCVGPLSFFFLLLSYNLLSMFLTGLSLRIPNSFELLYTSGKSASGTLPLTLKGNVSIVVQLSGELGNQLNKLAFGKCLQWMLRDDYSIRSHLVLRHQDASKWVRARNDCVRCFESLRSMDFSAANTQEFLDRKKQQKKWLGDYDARKLHLQRGTSESQITDSLDFLASLVRTNGTKFRNETDGSGKITVPFIFSDQFLGRSQVDRYYDELRSFFKLDEQKCCPQIPDEDEVVYHYRMFFGELPDDGTTQRFAELTANQTAKGLLGHLKPGNKIAIISRFPKHPQVIELVRTLKRERGLQTRVVSMSGVEDFCFLAKTKYQVAGFGYSSYLNWAVLLGNATTSWVYAMDWEPQKKPDHTTSWVHKIGWKSKESHSIVMEQLENPYHNPEMTKRTRFVKFYNSP